MCCSCGDVDREIPAFAGMTTAGQSNLKVREYIYERSIRLCHQGTLREMTGAGMMMDCKKALAETKGVMQEAVDWLRQEGPCQCRQEVRPRGGRRACRGGNGRRHQGGAIIGASTPKPTLSAATSSFRRWRRTIVEPCARRMGSDVEKLRRKAGKKTPNPAIPLPNSSRRMSRRSARTCTCAAQRHAHGK